MAVEADRRDWDDLAKLDLYWAALTEDSKRAGDWDVEEFLATGEREVNGLLQYASTFGYPARRERALDFGCGPGRLTRALAAQFGLSVGVDVSERMIEAARTLHRDADNCQFQSGGTDALDRFDADAFDLVYSSLVLQHVSQTEAVLAYIGDFVRVLAPGGLLAFQLPSFLPLRKRLQPRRRLYNILRSAGASPGFLYRRLGLDPLSLHAIGRDTVLALLEREGAKVIRADEETWPGEILSVTYFATK